MIAHTFSEEAGPEAAGTPVDRMTLSQLLAELRGVKDRKDQLNAQLSAEKKLEAAVKVAIRRRMAEQGMEKDGEKISGSGITVILRDKMRAVYDPSRWPEFVKWCTEHDYTHLIQRRITDSRVVELIDAGIALPEFLKVETYPDLDTWRG